MSKNKAHHHSIKVNCTMDEPIELLVDKLSSKSTDLYVFWQNYDHMYRQYNEKVSENCRLKEEIQHLKRTMSQPRQPEVRVHEDPYLKDRLKNSQSQCEQLRAEIQTLKSHNGNQKQQTIRLVQQISQMQILITQLREQNSQQRISIANILQKLKQAQNELGGQQKFYQEMHEKEIIIAKLVEKEKQMHNLLEDREEEIERMAKQFRDTKSKYERIIKESMQNAKETVMNSLPPNYKTITQKIRNSEY